MINKLLGLFRFSFLILVVHSVDAQIQTNPPVRQVLGTTGGSAEIVNWGTVDYTVGEVIVTSAYTTPSSSFPGFEWLTQGFQQPENMGLVVVVDTIEKSLCIGANNGVVKLKSRARKGVVYYSFNYGSYGTDSVFRDLPPGIYPYSAHDDKFTVSGTVTVEEIQEDCGQIMNFYSGITPNGDGKNDKWIIDSVDNFRSNRVSLFNRWGNLIWTAKNYDNEEVVWEGTNQKGNPLPDATYFYIIEAGDKVYKGWVELTH